MAWQIEADIIWNNEGWGEAGWPREHSWTDEGCGKAGLPREHLWMYEEEGGTTIMVH